MDRLEVSQIFIKGALIEVREVDFSKPEVSKIFEETEKRQQKLKELKEVDQEQLKLIVQL